MVCVHMSYSANDHPDPRKHPGGFCRVSSELVKGQDGCIAGLFEARQPHLTEAGLLL